MSRDLRQAYASQAALARKRFLELLEGDRARGAQAAMLAQCVGPNAATAFGKEHHFDRITDIDAYRRAVPIRHYEELAPWIERTANGESAVLTAQDPVRFWKTTGTTSMPKRIPVTPASAARTTEAFMTLSGMQLAHYPETNERNDTTLVVHLSPKRIKEYLGNGRVPYCTTTEVPVEVNPRSASFVAPWLVPLQDVVEDDAERLYFLLAFAALHDLRAIYCLHPSRFQTIVTTLDRVWPRLVGELHDGTLMGKAAREPRPDRAKELEAIAKRAGTLVPRDVWPNLRYTSAWSGSYIGRYMPVIEQAFATDFLAMPSISSECFLTMTVDSDRISQPLNIRGGIFEFIPADQRVEPRSQTLQFHELTVGESYEVVITTLAGLYRYATCDIFRVIGWCGEVPRLEYVGRRSVSDLTGEKLAEQQVEDVVRGVTRDLGAPAASFTLCALQGERPRYVLVIELPEANDSLAQIVDDRLRATNSRYELKRSFGDLEPLAVERVPAGTFAAYRELLVRRGMPAGQLKDRVLHATGAPVLADLRELGSKR